jgi:hypothetical protein
VILARVCEGPTEKGEKGLAAERPDKSSERAPPVPAAKPTAAVLVSEQAFVSRLAFSEPCAVKTSSCENITAAGTVATEAPTAGFTAGWYG